MLVPLREKYRVLKPIEKHTYRTRTGNSYGPTPKRQKGESGLGRRKRAYGPFF